MTSISDPRSPYTAVPQVNYDEPATKPPPLLEVGPLAWVRHNLFSSTFDTILTIAFGFIAVSIIIGLLGWSIGDANWFVINMNLRSFMVGRFPVDQLWRINVMAIYLLFTAGFSVRTWGHFSRSFVAVVLVLLALAFIVPPVVNSTTGPPVAYVAAGNIPIKAGTVTETPLPDVGFIARQGDIVSIKVAPVSTDEDLDTLSGFTDRASAAVGNAAGQRQAIFDQRAKLTEQLQSDLLTDQERTDLTAALDALKVPDAVTSTVSVNTQPTQVQIIDGATQKVIAEQTLTTSADVLTATLPTSGWYLLHKTVEADKGITLLETVGISPLIASQTPDGGNLYTRAVDGFDTQATRPKVNGKDAPMLVLLDNQFSGQRSFPTYMRLLVAPFLNQANVTLLVLAAAAAVGYAVATVLKRVRRHAQSRSLAQRLVPFLWLISPIIVYVLIASVNPDRWGGLLLTFLLTTVGLIASFPIGVLLALGRRSHLPIVKIACVLFIEIVRGVPLVSVLFIAQLMLPLLSPGLQTVPGVLRAMVGITLFSAAYLAENVRGGLQAIPPGQEEAAHALGLNTFQIITRITLPQALRLVIPALVGQAISLFKDTTLVAIVGLFDLLRIADTSVSQAEFAGKRAETFFFIGIIYFLFSFLMTYVSRRIEASGSGVMRHI